MSPKDKTREGHISGWYAIFSALLVGTFTLLTVFPSEVKNFLSSLNYRNGELIFTKDSNGYYSIDYLYKNGFNKHIFKENDDSLIFISPNGDKIARLIKNDYLLYTYDRCLYFKDSNERCKGRSNEEKIKDNYRLVNPTDSIEIVNLDGGFKKTHGFHSRTIRIPGENNKFSSKDFEKVFNIKVNNLFSLPAGGYCDIRVNGWIDNTSFISYLKRSIEEESIFLEDKIILKVKYCDREGISLTTKRGFKIYKPGYYEVEINELNDITDITFIKALSHP